MNIEEAKSNVGRLVMSTDPGWKMVKKLPPHGPYRLLQVTKGGTVILCGGLRVTPSHLTLYEEPAAHATENKSEAEGDDLQPIFVVVCSIDYEGSSVEGVFLSREAAEARRLALSAGGMSFQRYLVEEWKDGAHERTNPDTD